MLFIFFYHRFGADIRNCCISCHTEYKWEALSEGRRERERESPLRLILFKICLIMMFICDNFFVLFVSIFLLVVSILYLIYIYWIFNDIQHCRKKRMKKKRMSQDALSNKSKR